MLTLSVTLTNEEIAALEPKFAETEARLAKRLMGSEPEPRAPHAIAYSAWRKIAGPLGRHMESIRSRRETP